MDKERTSPIKRMKVYAVLFCYLILFLSFFLAWVVTKIFVFGFHQFLAKIIMFVFTCLVPMTFRLINIRLPPFLNTYRFRSRMCFFSPIPPPNWNLSPNSSKLYQLYILYITVVMTYTSCEILPEQMEPGEEAIFQTIALFHKLLGTGGDRSTWIPIPAATSQLIYMAPSFLNHADSFFSLRNQSYLSPQLFGSFSPQTCFS